MKMAGKRYLLDTNIVSAILDLEPGIGQKLENNEAYLSIVVGGELHYGANKSARRSLNIQRINSFVEMCTVLACDFQTALEYARIKILLKNKGQPIPENDIWIAATAFQYNLILVTRDKHFQNIPDLQLETW
jgi:tRNA(fMet)-specific endonuclease VapC